MSAACEPRPDPTFGETARRLGPRALPVASRLGAPWGDELLDRGLGRAAVVFDGSRLESDEQDALARIGQRASLRPHAPDGRTGEARSDGRLVLWCDPRLFSEEGANSRLFAAFEAAVRNLETPPAAPALMGVVNVTPDSFSDGGRYSDPARAIEHALELEAAGAAILDIGGESTRPGATPVGTREELARVMPVLEGLSGNTRARLSIDTTKAEVAAQALAAGAEIVNDISAGDDDARMWSVVAEAGCEYVVMHRQGDPATMQVAPRYADPVAEVCEWLRSRVHGCLKAGIEAPKIVLDPGIGFGKRLRHNLALLRRLPELRSLGRPLLLGVSRKSFIAHLTGAEKQRDWTGRMRQDRPLERVGGTAAALFACVQGGAEILRVHDVQVMSEALHVARALTNLASVTDPD